jgi:tetratricopeptide (TPR) repeat protein
LAISLIEGLTGSGCQSEISQNLLACYLNSALACLKLRKYAVALSHADAALKMDSQNVKGFFRRGEALFGLKRYADARSAF